GLHGETNTPAAVKLRERLGQDHQAWRINKKVEEDTGFSARQHLAAAECVGLYAETKAVAHMGESILRLNEAVAYNRYLAEAAKEIAGEAFQIGRATISAQVIDLDDPLGAEYDENVQRAGFAPSEAVAITELIEARARERAKERMHEGQKSGGRGKKKLPANL